MCVALVARARALHIIRFETQQGVREVEVRDGELLRSALLGNGVSCHNGRSQWINCRGLGTCGTCAVRVEGAVEPRSTIEDARLALPPHDATAGLRLACQCRVRGDVTVTKYAGFWGQHTATVVAAPEPSELPLGNLEFVLDRGGD